MPVTIVASAIDYLHHNDTVFYNFNVCFGTRCRWVLTKSYDDFADLHKLFAAHYSAVLLPHLTGPVRLWARHSDATAESRLPKLEKYLNESIATAALWTPRLHNAEVPNPDSACGETVTVNKFLGAFLQIAEHTAVPAVSAANFAKFADGRETGEGGTNVKEKETRVCSETAAELSEMPIGEEAAAPPREPLKVQLQSIMEKKGDPRESEEIALAATASIITTRINLNIRDFIIHERDHIEYSLHVSLCGQHWVVMKRFNEFRDLHNRLVEFYGESVVPSFSKSLVLSLRKLDVKTSEARKRFFNQYLQCVVLNVDSWEPQGLLASFELSRRTVRGDQARLTVYVNQILFTFLDFPAHIDALSGEAAAKAVVEQRATLSPSVQMAFDRRAIHEKRHRMREKVKRNADRLRALGETQLQRLLDRTALLQDDRDAVRTFRRLLATGEVDANGAEWRAEESEETNAIVSPETAAADARGAVVGITALQLARLTEGLFFNDTKIATIRLFAGVLIDVDDLQAVFDTLWFHWDEARADVEQILTSG